MSSDDEERRLWFRRCVVPLEPLLRAYAFRFSNGANDIDDLVHETFASLIGYNSWQGIDNVQAFAFRTLKNVALKAARRSRVVSITVIADLDSLNLVDEMPGAERVLEGRDELRRLAKLISELPPRCRKAFTLRKIYGLSNQEIAERLGLSISTVEKHVVKGLRLCSERLATGPAHGLRSRVTWTKARRSGESE